MSMKNSNDNIGIRTRELPASSAVPQPTAILGTPDMSVDLHIYYQRARCLILSDNSLKMYSKYEYKVK